MNKRQFVHKGRRRAGKRSHSLLKRRWPGRQVETASLEYILKARGLGPEAGGQSGDVEGLTRTPLADSESVEELAEEGQDLEAELIGGVEEAPDADETETVEEVEEEKE